MVVAPFLQYLASSGAHCTSGIFFFKRFELTKNYGLYKRKKNWQKNILGL